MLHTFNTQPDPILPDMMRFADALQTWLVFQRKHCVFVNTAANVFNVDPELIIEAATIHPCLVLEHRGTDNIKLWTIGHGDP